MTDRIVVAEKIADAGLRMLATHGEVDVAVGLDRDELLARVEGAAALVVRSATAVDAELIQRAAGLRVIGRAGIGVDNIDLEAAAAAGAVVVNAPASNIVSASELTMALLLAQARNVAAADATTRSGVWDRARFVGVELFGKTLGIIGIGRIGTLVAERASAFGMTLIGYDPYLEPAVIAAKGIEPLATLAELYARADFITMHLPRTPETIGMLGREAFAQMKPGVRIVNASRGGVVDEAALVEAIKEGTVAGAGLDVYESEPPTESPLFELPQVVLTPHLGASTVEAQDRAGTDVAEAIIAELRGERSPNRVG